MGFLRGLTMVERWMRDQSRAQGRDLTREQERNLAREQGQGRDLGEGPRPSVARDANRLANSGEKRASDWSAQRDSTFNTRIAEGLTGMNRGSLRYLEKRGVIAPARRDDSEYRAYTVADINRIVGLDVLKNSGIPVTEAWPDDEVAGTQKDVDGLIGVCLARNGELLAWSLAVRDCLERLAQLYAAESLMLPRLAPFEERLMWFNQERPGDELTTRSVRGGYSKLSPVASVTCVYDAHQIDGSDALLGRWGVSIPCRLVGAVDPEWDLDMDAAETLAGGTCVCVPIWLPSDASFMVDADGDIRRRMRKLAASKGLQASGPLVLADYLPVGQAVYATLSMLVE